MQLTEAKRCIVGENALRVEEVGMTDCILRALKEYSFPAVSITTLERY